MEIEIISDIEAIKTIDFIPEEKLQSVIDETGCVIAGYLENDIVVLGLFSYINSFNECVNIDYLYVLEEYRHQGYASDFLVKVCEVFEKTGVKKIFASFAGFQDMAEQWSYFFENMGFAPVAENPIEEVWKYFLGQNQLDITDQSIQKLDYQKNVFICEKHANEIVEKSPELKKYLEKEALRLTENSLIYVDNKYIEAALVLNVTDDVITLRGTFGAEDTDGAKVVSIIALLKYLSECNDLSRYQLNFRIENQVVEDAVNSIFRPCDLKCSYVKYERGL